LPSCTPLPTGTAGRSTTSCSPPWAERWAVYWPDAVADPDTCPELDELVTDLRAELDALCAPGG
jgi:hypothetical protein